jgi:hypothetical protein
MKRKFVYFLSIFAISFLFAKKVLAVCPLCTVGVTIGVGFSRWLGIDDTITGLWLGGLVVSFISWTENWLEKKNIRFRGRTFIDAVFYYALLIIPLYYAGLIGHPQNKLFYFGLSMDKLLFGIINGSIAFLCGASWYYYLKEKNQGKAYFPFQKVVMPLLPLIILSFIYYYLIK